MYRIFSDMYVSICTNQVSLSLVLGDLLSGKSVGLLKVKLEKQSSVMLHQRVQWGEILTPYPPLAIPSTYVAA